MPVIQKLAVGVAAALLIATAAHAEGNRSGGTVYPVLKPAAPEPAAVAAPAVAPVGSKVSASLTRANKRTARRQKEALKVATGPVETSPAPTPKKPDATGATPVQDGPREQPAPTLSQLVTKHANENGVPPALASAVVTIESRFNPKAKGGSALGLMQIKLDTARAMGFAGGAIALYEPEINLHFGMKVLADAFKASHGDVCMTLARYQSGHRVTRMSAANRSYCSRARSLMAKA